MISKIVAGFMNWLVASVVIPAIVFVYDVVKLRKENKELKKSIEELKNAKTKADIDRAIDNIP